ncbi:hypothetical protein SAMN04489712_105422 [Thermomonospora echinospora]|uniref:4-amino-4-deoxy-L-arabinose transferase n=1 Tax=Thermomonospora echinospora TaxID=1992 RepID=A0A1H6AFD5_9ACTN|nr:hypothetical protein [Thermomonospora echinospora]SEG47463.1 hypothetical protein SAMN04489712_105422 [Thermomonospora echinospora]
MDVLLPDPHRLSREPASADRPQDPEARRLPPRWLPWWLLLAVGWLAQAGVRVGLAAGQTMPVANPDETGYLFAARLLSGGPPADISNSTPYRGGYSLLILPAVWLGGEDPVTVYRLALVINALLGATLLLLAYQLLRRLGLSPGWAYAVAHVTALLPAAVFYTQYALTDAVLPVVLLGWLLLLHSWLVGDVSPARMALYGAGASLAAAYAYTMHSRGVVIVAVHAGLLLLAVVRRWRPWWSAGLGALAAALVAGAGSLLNGWIWPQLYPRGSYDMGSMLVDRLTTPEGYGWTIPVGIGQIWYLIVGSWGLAGIGLLAMAAVAFGRGVPSRLRALALGVLATVAGIAFATAAALPDEQRVGNHAYGRYLACLAPLLFAVGVAVLLRASRRTALRAAAAVAVVTAAAAALIELRAGGSFGEYVFFPFDFPETGFLTWDWDSLRLWTATLAGLGLLALTVAMAVAGRRSGAVLLVGVLLVVNAAASVATAARVSRPFVREMTAASDLSGLLDPAAKPRVAIDGNVDWKIWVMQLYQVSWSQVLWFDSRYERPPTRADLVLMVWDGKVPAERTWADPPAGWRVAGSRRTAEGHWVAWRRS